MLCSLLSPLIVPAPSFEGHPPTSPGLYVGLTVSDGHALAARCSIVFGSAAVQDAC